ncbi:MAG: 23S rRNA (adenine(2503)-C(2))-methyltransferase RlmN [Bacteroidota bacterium]
MKKVNLKGLTIGEMENLATSIGEQKYRGRQLFYWIYNRGATTFAEMTDLSRAFRQKLTDAASLESLSMLSRKVSSLDGTVKYLFELQDGAKIESVLVPPSPSSNGAAKRLTLCISTQVGCPLDCKFCATGSMGFTRNLTAGEIVDQVLHVRRDSPSRITNLVYMGMGEPLMNYDAVMKSAEILSNECSVGISAKRMTISTAGWADGIRRMADEKRKMKLALSLHTLDTELRTKLMPLNRKFDVAKLIEAVRYYYEKTKQRITYEYILFDGLNDADGDIRRLVSLSRKIPCKINLIPFHLIDFTQPKGFAATLRPTPPDRVGRFAEKLRDANVTVMVRSSAGKDIEAACGQLAVKNEREKKRIELEQQTVGTFS